MKRLITLSMLVFSAVLLRAQEPNITLKATVGKTLDLAFASLTDQAVQVDFGDGELATIDVLGHDDLIGWFSWYLSEGKLSGTVKGEGEVKIYGDCSAIDLSYIADNECKISELNLISVSNLLYLDCYSHDITTLDLSKATNLTDLSCYSNPLKTLDLSKNTQLTKLDCKDNGLSVLDLTGLDNLNTVNCSNNNIAMYNLPKKVSKYYYYNPQSDFVLPSAELTTGGTVDLSAFEGLVGVAESAQVTTYNWMINDSTALVEGTDYTVENGLFTFNTAADSIFCKIASPAFPFMKTYKTTAISVATVTPNITLKATVGKTLDLSFASLTNQAVQVDFGDGELATIDVLGHDDLIGWFSWYLSEGKLSGTVKGEGEVKIYGDCSAIDLSYIADNECKISELNLISVSNLLYLDCYSHDITTLDLSKATNLTNLSCYSNPLQTLDVSNNTQLTKLDCNDNGLSTLDLTGLDNLNTVYCNNNNIAMYNLPKKVSKYYYYNPQSDFVLPSAELTTGGTVDLSAFEGLVGVAESAQVTTYNWMINDSTALVEGTDYTVENGVFTFNTAADSIFCKIASPAFPLMKTYKTTAISVTVVVGVESATKDNLLVRGTADGIVITHPDSPVSVTVISINGAVIDTRSNVYTATIAVPAGTYIVKTTTLNGETAVNKVVIL